MINMHTQSVTVSKFELLAALKTNLEIHRREYQETLDEFYAALTASIKELQKTVKNAAEDPRKLATLRFNITFPQSYEKNYLDAIDLISYSVKDEIELDGDAFRAYFKNEWVWKRQFDAVKTSYASASMMSL